MKFSPDGSSLASASADKSVLLWNVYGDCKKLASRSTRRISLISLSHSFGQIRIPKGAPTSLAYASDTTLVIGSTDHAVFLYNLKTGLGTFNLNPPPQRSD